MGDFDATIANGLPLAFLTVFLAGIATSLTPCVYPMIPITVGIFGARESTSRGHAFLLASCYVMGIALMYSILGVLAALGGWATGGLLANPWFVVPLALFFLLMASSMFGLWDIRIPHGLQHRLASVGSRGFGAPWAWAWSGAF